jgi:hypothetical protein
MLGGGWEGALKHYFSQLLNFQIIAIVLLPSHHSDYLVPPTLPEIILTITMTFALNIIPTARSSSYTFKLRVMQQQQRPRSVKLACEKNWLIFLEKLNAQIKEVNASHPVGKWVDS